MSRPKPQPIRISPARRAAFEILTLVESRRGHSDDLLHSRHTAELSPEDRNLATALVMGVLRWQIALDARVLPFLQRPDQQLATPVAIALRMGAFQLLHMDRIPAHAVLSESVELAKVAGHAHAAGMVNAILRRLAATPSPGVPIYEPIAAFAARLGHPAWLAEHWTANYGRAAAIAICEADQQEPTDAALFVSSQQNLPRIDNGSRLVAELAAAASPSAAPRVWDACAAPGGKTLILAARLAAASILATDISPRRLQQMQHRLHQHSYAEWVKTEVAAAAAVQGVFDLILCDVPCSGTGTFARNPEIRHFLEPQDLQRQASRQCSLLSSALRNLAPGGRLIYSTCSLEPEENEEVVEQVLSTHPDIRRVPINLPLSRLVEDGILEPEAAAHLHRTAIRDGALRTLPGVHPCDGFFAVLLER